MRSTPFALGQDTMHRDGRRHGDDLRYQIVREATILVQSFDDMRC